MNLIQAKGEPFYAAFDVNATGSMTGWTFTFEAWSASTGNLALSLSADTTSFYFDENVKQLVLSLGPDQTEALFSVSPMLYNVTVRRPQANSFLLFRGRVIVEDWKAI